MANSKNPQATSKNHLNNMNVHETYMATENGADQQTAVAQTPAGYDRHHLLESADFFGYSLFVPAPGCKD
jgi:hypothetical protein